MKFVERSADRATEKPRDPSPASLVSVLAVSVAVAWCGAVGASYVLGRGEAAFSPLVVAGITLVGTVFFACIALLVMFAYANYLGRTDDTSLTGIAGRLACVIPRITPQWRRRNVLAFCGVMGVFWLPWLIANYPGGAYWDTYYQIHQCFPENHPISIVPFGDHGKDTLTDAYFCDHHPLLDTLIYGGFAAASQALTGAWNAGTFAFVVLQGAATILALTASVAYVRKLGAPCVLCFLAFVFFCVMPFISTWALTMVKDSLFSLVYVPYFMMVLAAVATRGESLAKTRAIVVFMVLGVLLCLTKKTGVYVVVPTAVVTFCVLACQKRRVRFRRMAVAFGGQALACVMVMQLLLPFVVFPLLNVAPGGAQESLGLPLQQTAAFVHAYPDEVSPEEKAAIDAVIPYERVEEEHDPVCQDAVKYWYEQNATSTDVKTYLRTWAAMGLRHPEVYLAALLAIGGSYLAPCHSLNIRTTTCDTWQDGTHVLYNPESLKWLREGMASLYEGYANLPVACLPVQAVVWVFWIPALLLLVTWRFRPREVVLFVPGGIVLAFCVIGPIFDARYCLPLLYTVPILTCFVFRKPTLMRNEDGPSAVGFSPDRVHPVAAKALRSRRDEYGCDETFGGNNHGLDIGHGRDAAVHGSAGCLRCAVRSEGGERPPHA